MSKIKNVESIMELGSNEIVAKYFEVLVYLKLPYLDL